MKTFKLTTNEIDLIIGGACLIMGNKAPFKIKLSPFEGLQIEVEVVPTSFSETKEDVANYGPSGHSAWDQVKVNGKHCGNRHAGKEEYTRLVFEFLASSRKKKTVQLTEGRSIDGDFLFSYEGEGIEGSGYRTKKEARDAARLHGHHVSMKLPRKLNTVVDR